MFTKRGQSPAPRLITVPPSDYTPRFRKRKKEASGGGGGNGEDISQRPRPYILFVRPFISGKSAACAPKSLPLVPFPSQSSPSRRRTFGMSLRPRARLFILSRGNPWGSLFFSSIFFDAEIVLCGWGEARLFFI